MSFKQHIFNWLISKKNVATANKQFLNWTQLSNVLIVVYDHQLSNCVEFINICKKDKINVQVAIIFDGKPEHAPKPDFNHLILDKKQFSIFKMPSKICLQKLNVEPIDALINLGNNEQLKALGLTKMIQAKCKIGNFQNPVFDIIINADKTMNSSEYLKQVVVYLNMIKTSTKYLNTHILPCNN